MDLCRSWAKPVQFTNPPEHATVQAENFKKKGPVPKKSRDGPGILTGTRCQNYSGNHVAAAATVEFAHGRCAATIGQRLRRIIIGPSSSLCPPISRTFQPAFSLRTVIVRVSVVVASPRFRRVIPMEFELFGWFEP
jgi:hypothetical protein